jgi:CHAT domain-containing protein/Flp pilus assembly protein TadD
MVDVAEGLDCRQIEERDFVDLYLAEVLPEEEARRFEQHYFGCERCWDHLQTALELKAASQAVKPAARQVQRRKQPWLAAAAVLLLVAGAAFWAVRRASGPVDADAAVRELARAAEGPRVLDGRLAGFSYAPPRPVTRGAAADIPAKTKAAAYRVLGRESDKQDAGTHHAAGIAQILIGNLDEGIKELVEAARINPSDALLQSDLAAAYLERSLLSPGPEDREQALRSVDKALELKPDSPDALFNRAVILESMHGGGETERAWEAFLTTEPSGAWADEARRRLAAIRKRSHLPPWPEKRDALEQSLTAWDPRIVGELATSFSQELRMWVGDRALPQWGARYLQGDETAGLWLRASRDAAAALAAKHSDQLLVDTVAVVYEAKGERLRTLAAGHREYGAARSLYPTPKTSEALSGMENAENDLRTGRSPFADVARVYRSALTFQLNEVPRAQALLRSVDVPTQYVSLTALACWMQGNFSGTAGRYEEALARYRVAQSAFERLGETENIASAHNLLASSLVRLGQRDNAWLENERALAFFDAAPSGFRFHSLLNIAAEQALEEGKYATALIWQHRIVANARFENDPELTADALRDRALIEDRLGRHREALDDVAAAQHVAGRIPEPTVSQGSLARIEIAEADLIPAEPERAIQLLDSAIAFFRQPQRSKMLLPDCYLKRGRAWLAAGSPGRALSDFDEGIQILEAQRLVSDPGLRLTTFIKAQELFDEAESLLANEGKAAEALQYSERSRSRLLLDALVPRPADPDRLKRDTRTEVASIRSIQRRLPDDVTLLEYDVLPDRLLIWTLTHDVCELTTASVSRGDLEGLVSALLKASQLREEEQAFRQCAAQLGRILLGPLPPRPAGTIAFVPDGVLWKVPFAALLRSPDEPFLIEVATVMATPSAAFFTEARSVRPSADRALVVGVSTALPGEGLKALTYAESEARAVASVLGHSELLVGEQATRGRFLQRAPLAREIHFAGHALTRPNPMASTLRLSEDTGKGDSGLIYFPELARLDLSRTLLVVASGCATASGQLVGREGAASLVDAFLLAGAASVVGSLWSIDDRDTAPFFSAFYNAYRVHSSPATALRAAQLGSLQTTPPGDKSRTWSAFMLVGSLENLRDRPLMKGAS